MATLLQLRTRAKRLADLETHAHILDPEWTDYVNEAEEETYDLLVSASLGYFESEQTIATDGVDGLYALPSDFYECLQVQYKFSSDRWTKLKPLNLYDHSLADYGASSGATEAHCFRLRGGDLQLLPVPPSGQTYRMLYAPRRTELALDGDVSVIPDRWSQGTVIRAAISGLLKQERGVKDHAYLLERFEKRVEKHRRNRLLEGVAVPESGRDRLDPSSIRPYRRVW